VVFFAARAFVVWGGGGGGGGGRERASGLPPWLGGAEIERKGENAWQATLTCNLESCASVCVVFTLWLG
jgi:hypothetical protein